ncbi:MAG: hypothetical protein K1X29_00585 [Bdellovibrionales bacterium]|nr:hypothetical protein [Bdellovibrionales bacterium]
MIRTEKRARRKQLETIEVTEITTLEQYRILAHSGQVIDASTSGILIQVDRKNIVPIALRQTLSLQHLIGQQVVMYLPQMSLDLDGTITRADHVGKGLFSIGLEFSKEVPLYWRECLIELLPSPGEV